MLVLLLVWGVDEWAEHNLIFANDVYTSSDVHAYHFIGDGSQLTGFDAGQLDFSGEIVMDELILQTNSNSTPHDGLSYQSNSGKYLWNIKRTASRAENGHNASLVFAGGTQQDQTVDLPHVMSLREDGLVFIGADPDGIISLDGRHAVDDMKFGNGDYKLAVAGKVMAEEVIVLNSDNWADFVFEENYELQSLEEVEAYIEANGHLEYIPTSSEVEDKGINLGEMDAMLLRKIEEITLHVIDMYDRVKELKMKNSKLRSAASN